MAQKVAGQISTSARPGISGTTVASRSRSESTRRPGAGCSLRPSTGRGFLSINAITIARSETLSIGELSRPTGVNTETIRYCERVKMLPAPLRTGGGRRIYGATERRILAFIRRGRKLGFTLKEIRSLPVV